LVPDELNFLSQYVLTTISRRQDQQQRSGVMTYAQSVLNQPDQQASGSGACHGAQDAQNNACVQQICQSMSTACSQSLHNATYTSPTIVPTDDKIMKDSNNQR
jgi:hypothetical protein